ncbi:hypothetical protein BDV93DRAFT_521214 [Ceratobasidium sp. AG-I]|nr:hypothetical protein BDV93DRAFT_521214 [Ceratobasidium sp. AG-I]
MHSVARASSFVSSPSMNPSASSYYSYHHSPASAATSHSLSTSEEPLTPSSQEASSRYVATRVEPPTPARGCLKSPTKEFGIAFEHFELAPSTSERQTPSIARRRPNMTLGRLPSNAIARIQLEDMGSNPGQGATNSRAGSKCKQRVLTPYVKSDEAEKMEWISDGEE